MVYTGAARSKHFTMNRIKSILCNHEAVGHKHHGGISFPNIPGMNCLGIRHMLVTNWKLKT